MMRFSRLVLGAAAFLVFGAAAASPFIPASDDVVLERLPEKGDPSLAQLKRMRSLLVANPGNLDVALQVARRAIEAARSLGDPRFLGEAQSALLPWWTGDDVPRPALLLRATLKQSQHDFAGSLADLDRLLAADPEFAQARLTRATVLAVVGRYDEARADCAALVGHAAPLVVAGCDATPASMSGHATDAYDALIRSLRGRAHDGVREWALTLAAEMAARRGDVVAAARHFEDALRLDSRDPYLKGAYADFLLDCGRPAGVTPLLRGDERNDSLLLRLALAEQRLPDQRRAFAAHRDELAARFDAARRRGDSLHRREEARYRLSIRNDPRAAVALALANWAVQREPADLLILAESARAAADARAIALAADWIASHRIEFSGATGNGMPSP